MFEPVTRFHSGPDTLDASPMRAASSGGIGDVNSPERGTGARFNAGKAPMELIPLRMIVDSFHDTLPRAIRDAGEVTPVMSALCRVAEFQERPDRRHLVDAFASLSHHWEDCARVFDYGRRKYAAWNWAKGMPWSVPMGCIGRHALAIMRGEDDDAESGLPHVGHIMCNIVMLALYVETYPEGNDLPDPRLFRVKDANHVG